MSEGASDSCAGACCAVFFFPITPPEVPAWVAAANDEQVERPYIADMLIPLTNADAMKRFADLGYGQLSDVINLEQLDKVEGNLHTCRHWDAQTRLCTAYDERPNMCRDFPYDTACPYGCGYVPSPEVIAVWQKIHKHEKSGQFDWSEWRWDVTERAYRTTLAGGVDKAWAPGEKWTWDGTWLRCTSPDYQPEEVTVGQATPLP